MVNVLIKIVCIIVTFFAEPGINVKCADETMFIFLERTSFQGFDPSKLTLLYPSCRASYNATHITLQTSLNDCGTTHNESEDTITFYNKVQSVQFSPWNVITREQNVSIAFYCSYGRKALVRNPSFKTWKNIFTASEGKVILEKEATTYVRLHVKHLSGQRYLAASLPGS